MQLDQNIAAQVSRAERELEAAQARHTEASAKRQDVQARENALKREREAIIAKRQNGDDNEGEAARLSVIDADREGLAPLLASAQAEAQQADPQRERTALNEARKRWQHHQAQVRYASLDERVREIESVFLAAVGELHAAGRGIGRTHLSQSYKPGHGVLRLINHGALPSDSA